MHSVLLHPLGIYMVVFSIPRLLNPDTRQQVGSMDAHAFHLDSLRILRSIISDLFGLVVMCVVWPWVGMASVSLARLLRLVVRASVLHLVVVEASQFLVACR